MTESKSAEPRFTIGQSKDGRCAVDVDGKAAGHIYRFHGLWYAVTLASKNETRHLDATTAAQHLVKVADGHSTLAATPRKISPTPESLSPCVYPPQISPRLRLTSGNAASASIAIARLTELAWEPLEGYVGADNLWLMRCLLCRKPVRRFWSHLRGRNGDNIPRPLIRHKGCIPVADHATQIAWLTPKPRPTCLCPFFHPTANEDVAHALKSIDVARQREDGKSLFVHIARVVGPCPASSARAEVLKQLRDKQN